PREGAGQRGPARAEEGFEAALDVLPDLAPLLGRDLLFVLVLPQAEGLAMAVQAVAGLAKLRAHAVADRRDHARGVGIAPVAQPRQDPLDRIVHGGAGPGVAVGQLLEEVE